ncbi:MAG: alpha/beta fold hydrolase [Gammaproteobacteria bacterium]
MSTQTQNKRSYSLTAWKSLGILRAVEDRSLFVIDSAYHNPAALDRPVILMLHGFPTSSWDWQHQWDTLAADFRVIAFDMLGFGFSEKPYRHRYTIHEQADLAEALISDLGVGPFSVLAHDYGDTVAQELLARDNDRVETGEQTGSIRAVCLLNGGLFPETHRARRAQKLLVGPAGGLFVKLFGEKALARNLTNVFGKNTPPSQEELNNFWYLTLYNNGRRNLHRLMWYMKDRIEHRSRWLSALVDTSAPLALINGSSDPVSGSHMVQRYKQLVGKGEIIELPDIGHYPQLEAPDDVTQHSAQFLRKHI